MEQVRSRTSLVVPVKRPNKAARSGGGGRGGKEASVGGRADDGRMPGHRPGQARRAPRRQPADRGRRGSQIRDRRSRLDLRQEPGAGKPHAGICAGAGSNACPYRDRGRRRRRSRSVHSDRVGCAIEPRKNRNRRGRDGGKRRRRHERSPLCEGPSLYRRSKTTSRTNGSRRNLGRPRLARSRLARGKERGETIRRRPMLSLTEKHRQGAASGSLLQPPSTACTSRRPRPA